MGTEKSPWAVWKSAAVAEASTVTKRPAGTRFCGVPPPEAIDMGASGWFSKAMRWIWSFQELGGARVS